MSEFLIFKYLGWLEIILNITSQLLTIYYLLIFLKSSLIHVNMIRIIKLIAFYYLLSQTARLVVATKEVIVDDGSQGKSH